jgi:hypothetical protein
MLEVVLTRFKPLCLSLPSSFLLLISHLALLRDLAPFPSLATMECPLCKKFFSQKRIEFHSAECPGSLSETKNQKLQQEEEDDDVVVVVEEEEAAVRPNAFAMLMSNAKKPTSTLPKKQQTIAPALPPPSVNPTGEIAFTLVETIDVM